MMARRRRTIFCQAVIPDFPERQEHTLTSRYGCARVAVTDMGMIRYRTDTCLKHYHALPGFRFIDMAPFIRAPAP